MAPYPDDGVIRWLEATQERGEASEEFLFARLLRRNDASRRVLEKLGFVAVGIEIHEHPRWTADDPVVRHMLLRGEWTDMEGAGPDGGRPRPHRRRKRLRAWCPVTES